jgi:hypothetical protein
VFPVVQIPDPIADDLVYVCTKQAAEAMGVAPCTITRWRNLGYLKAQPGSPPRKPVYLWDDVVEAEFTARMAAIAASGTDVQCQRRAALTLAT